MCFNVHCNNVARQVEEKCCPCLIPDLTRASTELTYSISAKKQQLLLVTFTHCFSNTSFIVSFKILVLYKDSLDVSDLPD